MTSPTLGTFVREARERVATGYYDHDARTADAPARSLAAAVRAHAGRAVIAEIKPASPTRGTMRASVDAAKLAQSLAAAGAIGLSALAEPARFGGSLSNVASATDAGIPVLFKDFVVDARQIDAARSCGASAVLLILDSTPEDELIQLIEHTHTAGLEVLLEVYDRDGLARALRTRADLIGINNRDLRQAGLPVDLRRTARTLESDRPDRPILALSGVHNGADARSLFQAGASAILVGTALMRAADPATELSRLIGELT